MKISCNSGVGASSSNVANAQKNPSFKGKVTLLGNLEKITEEFILNSPHKKYLQNGIGELIQKGCIDEFRRTAPESDELILKAITPKGEESIVLNMNYVPGEVSQKKGLKAISQDWTTLGRPAHLVESMKNLITKVKDANLLPF